MSSGFTFKTYNQASCSETSETTYPNPSAFHDIQNNKCYIDPKFPGNQSSLKYSCDTKKLSIWNEGRNTNGCEKGDPPDQEYLIYPGECTLVFQGEDQNGEVFRNYAKIHGVCSSSGGGGSSTQGLSDDDNVGIGIVIAAGVILVLLIIMTVTIYKPRSKKSKKR